MVQVIHGGSDAFDMLLYPEQSPLTYQYLQDKMSRFSETLTQAGSRFIEGSRQLFEQVQNSDLIRRTKAAIRSAKAYFHPNMIRPLETLEELQSATLVMQRWVMAQPDIRRLYHRQLVDGYNETYVDMHPGQVGVEHYDYRRVMSGVGVDTEDGEEWRATVYSDDLVEGDRELDFGEKVDVLRTWEIVAMYAKARREDPTNIYGGDMG